MRDLSAWKVFGPVHQLRTEFAEWDRNLEDWQPPRGFSVMQFRPDGKLQDRETHNPNGSLGRLWLDYDDRGRLIETRFRLDDRPATKTMNSYDGEGRLVRIVSVDPDGVAREAESHRYDESGRRSRTQFLEPQNPNTGYAFSIEGSEQAYGGAGATTLTTTYDENGKASEALFHDAHRKLLNRVTLAWDAVGRLVREELHFGEQSHLVGKVFGSQQAMWVTTHVYDREGRPVERITSYGMAGEDRTTFRYGPHGNPVEQTMHHISREVGMDEEGNVKVSKEASHTQHTRYEYQFDVRGNWTGRVVWGGLEPNPNFERGNVERREIEYFETPANG